MRSDAVKKGSQQAPHRSLFNALGMTKEEMERPLVGIVSSYKAGSSNGWRYTGCFPGNCCL